MNSVNTTAPLNNDWTPFSPGRYTTNPRFTPPHIANAGTDDVAINSTEAITSSPENIRGKSLVNHAVNADGAAGIDTPAEVAEISESNSGSSKELYELLNKSVAAIMGAFTNETGADHKIIGEFEEFLSKHPGSKQDLNFERDHDEFHSFLKGCLDSETGEIDIEKFKKGFENLNPALKNAFGEIFNGLAKPLLENNAALIISQHCDGQVSLIAKAFDNISNLDEGTQERESDPSASQTRKDFAEALAKKMNHLEKQENVMAKRGIKLNGNMKQNYYSREVQDFINTFNEGRDDKLTKTDLNILNVHLKEVVQSGSSKEERNQGLGGLLNGVFKGAQDWTKNNQMLAIIVVPMALNLASGILSKIPIVKHLVPSLQSVASRMT